MVIPMQDGAGVERFVQSVVDPDLEAFVEGTLPMGDLLAARVPDMPEIPDAPTDRLLNLWRELVFRGVSSSEDALTVQADWNPAAHPRGPDGQFVERPWDIPDDILGMDTEEIIGELARDDPDFVEKARGLQVGMDRDLVEVAQEAVQESTDTDGGSTVEGLIDKHGLDDLDSFAAIIEEAGETNVDIDELAERLSEEASGTYLARAGRDVAESATVDVDGYDADARLAYTYNQKEFPQEVESEFLDNVDSDTAETVNETFGNWELDFFSEQMAPLWQTAVEDTGNSALLRNEESVLEPTVSDAEKEAIRQQKEHTQEILREIYGDTIPVYRAFQGDAGRDLEAAAEAGEEIELDRRSLESYSTELSYTKNYVRGQPGAIIKREVPVEDVWAASDAGFLGPEENELVVEHTGPETISPDDILTKEDLDDGETNVRLIVEQIRGLEK